MLKLIYTSTKTVPDLGTDSSASGMIWIPNVEAIHLTRTTLPGQPFNFTTDISRLYRDGTVVHVSEFSVAAQTEFSAFAQAPNFSGAVTSQQDTLPHPTFEIDPILWNVNLQKPVMSLIPPLDKVRNALYLRNREGVLKYYHEQAFGFEIFNAETGIFEQSVNVFPPGSFPILSVHWVKNQTIAIFASTGELSIYDLDTMSEVLHSWIDQPVNACIDSTYQNVVSVRKSDRKVQIWDLAIQPDHFSGFSTMPGTFARYRKEDVSITVRGSQNEPVADVGVVWSIKTLQQAGGVVDQDMVDKGPVDGEFSIVQSRGAILPSVSTTDDAGVARVTYCPPGHDWETGTREIITARVFS